MKNFMIGRIEVVSSLDLNIIGTSPIIQKAKFMGRYQLEYGKVQHADTEYRTVQFQDNLSWFQLFPQGVNYQFFKLSAFTISPHFTFEKKHLYMEWFTLDALED